jgi:hypothetical protein
MAMFALAQALPSEISHSNSSLLKLADSNHGWVGQGSAMVFFKTLTTIRMVRLIKFLTTEPLNKGAP